MTPSTAGLVSLCALLVLDASLVAQCHSEPTWLGQVHGCSEAVCGPRVSKCILLKSCNCTMSPEIVANNTCTCCKDCVKCLADHYSDCCSCVGLCRARKQLAPSLVMQSVVHDLSADAEHWALFHMLTADTHGPDDQDKQWTVDSFPTLSGGVGDILYKDANPQDSDEQWRLSNLNCTVAYIKQCHSLDRCIKACESMGAAYVRWFHSGCCECGGHTCLNYGSKQAKCSLCPQSDDDAHHSFHRKLEL